MSQNENFVVISDEKLRGEWPQFVSRLEKPLQMLFNDGLVHLVFISNVIAIETNQPFMVKKLWKVAAEISQLAKEFYGGHVSIVPTLKYEQPKQTNPQAEEWKAPIELHGWVKVWSWEELDKLLTTEGKCTIPGIARISRHAEEFDIFEIECDISGRYIGEISAFKSLAADFTGRPFILPNWVIDAFQVQVKQLPEPVKIYECEKLLAELSDLHEKIQKLVAAACE